MPLTCIQYLAKLAWIKVLIRDANQICTFGSITSIHKIIHYFLTARYFFWEDITSITHHQQAPFYIHMYSRLGGWLSSRQCDPRGWLLSYSREMHHFEFVLN